MTKPEEEKESPLLKMPSEKDLERYLTDVKKDAPKEEKVIKEEANEKKPQDNQLARALELLKSWEVFKTIAQGT